MGKPLVRSRERDGFTAQIESVPCRAPNIRPRSTSSLRPMSVTPRQCIAETSNGNPHPSFADISLPREVFDDRSRLHPLWIPWRQFPSSSRQRTTVHPFIARETHAQALSTNSSTPITKPSRPCGRSDSSASTAFGEATGIPPWPPTKTAVCSNPVSLASGARTANSSSSSRSPAGVVDSVRLVARSEPRSSPSCSNTRFSRICLTLNGCSRSQKCETILSIPSRPSR